MYSEPYGRGCRIGPVDAMTAVRGDVEPIAGPQQARLGLVGKPQLGGAGKHQHPFALRLVVPEPRRARLTQARRSVRPAYRAGSTMSRSVRLSARREGRKAGSWHRLQHAGDRAPPAGVAFLALVRGH